MLRDILAIKTAMGNQCYLVKITCMRTNDFQWPHIVHTSLLTERSTNLVILGKMYIENTLEFLGEIPGEAGGAIWSYSNKNCHIILFITISNQNCDKT